MKNYLSRFLALLMTIVSLLGVFPYATAYSASNESSLTSVNTVFGSISGWGINRTGGSIQVFDNENLTNNSSQTHWIYNQEGFTIIRAFTNYSPWRYEVSYSTSTDSTGRTGFISKASGVETFTSSSFGTSILYSTNVWYGKNTNSYQPAGSVGSGEIVAALAVDGDWVYIEYNTTSGRKRGWCLKNKMLLDSTGLNPYPSGSESYEQDSSFGYKTVYAGPGNQYATVGQIATNNKPESVHIMARYNFSGATWLFIRYSTTNGYKTGYILN